MRGAGEEFFDGLATSLGCWLVEKRLSSPTHAVSRFAQIEISWNERLTHNC
jgi:predicted DsbA family dithiol-disulfide isomerase